MVKTSEKVMPIKQEEKAPEISQVEAAKKVIEQEKIRISKECAEEVQAVLKKYNCTIDVWFTYTPAQGHKKGFQILAAG